MSAGSLELLAHLAVDLHDERDRLGLRQRRVGLRPGLLVDAVAVAGALPELLGDVRRRGGHHQDQRLERLVPGGGADVVGLAGAAEGVGELHQAREHRVEAEVLIVVGDDLDCAVAQALEVAHRLFVRPGRKAAAPGRGSRRGSASGRCRRCPGDGRGRPRSRGR